MCVCGSVEIYSDHYLVTVCMYQIDASQSGAAESAPETPMCHKGHMSSSQSLFWS